jgi:ATP-binding cassette subfamily B protein
MLKLFRYLKPYILLLIVLAGFTYLQVRANLALPDYMAKIVNDGIIAKNNDAIYSNGLMMILITLGGGLCAVAVGYLAAKIATGFSKRIRKSVFEKVESFSVAEFDKFSTASLITRTTNDIQQIQMTTIMLLRLVLMAPLMAIGALQNAIATAPSMSWIIAVGAGTLLVIIALLFTFALPKFKLIQKVLDKLNRVSRENLTGLRVIRAFNNETEEEKKFDRTNKELTKLNLYVNRMMVVLQPAMMLIMNMSVLAIVWFGAHLIDEGSIDIGGMMAFMQYAVQVIMSFLMISIMFIMVPRAAVSANRVAETIEAETSIKDPVSPEALPKGPYSLEFKNVSFTYPDADDNMLKNISFTAEPGQTTALIGGTGSGKSTIINLIPRFYDPTKGEIYIGGVDIKKLKLTDIRESIGLVPQKAVLFSGTIESNINYGGHASNEDEIKDAAATAQASEFVDKLEHGYKNHVAQGGSNVSGGQKQRLAIARAIAHNPEIFIFDDSFSAVDYKTDLNLRRALGKKTANKTVLIVGQRIGTIIGADKIIVLDKGEIVGQGTHSELLKKNKVYQEIAYSQLSDEELDDYETELAKEVKNG